MATTVTVTLGANITIVITESSAQPGTLNNWADQVGYYGIRVTQQALEVLAQGIPNIRVTQQALEILAMGIPSARITQLALEVVVKRGGQQPRVWIST